MSSTLSEPSAPVGAQDPAGSAAPDTGAGTGAGTAGRPRGRTHVSDRALGRIAEQALPRDGQAEVRTVDGRDDVVDVDASVVAPWPLGDPRTVGVVAQRVRRDLHRLGGREARDVKIAIRAFRRNDGPGGVDVPVGPVASPATAPATDGTTARPARARRSVDVPSPVESLLVLLLALAVALVAALAVVELVALAFGADAALVDRGRMGRALLRDRWDTDWVVAAGVGATLAGLALLAAGVWPRRPRSLPTTLRAGDVAVDVRRVSVEDTLAHAVQRDLPDVIDARARCTRRRATVRASLVRDASADTPVEVERRARELLGGLGLGELPVRVRTRRSKRRAR